MADKLTRDGHLARTADNPLHMPPSPETPPATAAGKSAALVPWVIIAMLLAAVAWLGWRAFFYQQEGDLVGSAMLAFEKQNSLTVFSSRFEIVAESVDTRGVLGIDMLETRQAAIIPAMVEYRVDLSGIERDQMRWDEARKTLEIILPPLAVSRPNLDEGNAKYYVEGIYVTRDAARDLSRNNSRLAERKALVFARNPEVLAMARQAARDTVRQNLAIPLQIAGHGDVSVDVRFASQIPEKEAE